MPYRGDVDGFRSRPTVVPGWAAGAALLLAACSSANGAACPAKDADERLRIIASAASCRAAVRVNDACAEGTGADTEPTAVVISRCEGDFKPGLSPSRLKSYAASLATCEKKYEDRAGSLYRSFTIYCQERVAARYASRSRR